MYLKPSNPLGERDLTIGEWPLTVNAHFQTQLAIHKILQPYIQRPTISCVPKIHSPRKSDIVIAANYEKTLFNYSIKWIIGCSTGMKVCYSFSDLFEAQKGNTHW